MNKEYCVMVFDDCHDVFMLDCYTKYQKFYFDTFEKAMDFAKEMIGNQDKVVVAFETYCGEE